MNFPLARLGGMIIPLKMFKIFLTYTLSCNIAIGTMSKENTHLYKPTYTKKHKRMLCGSILRQL